MNLLEYTFHYLGDARALCTCRLGEYIRTVIGADDLLGHTYGFYLGELICFALYAQRKLFHHFVGAIYCYLGLATGFHQVEFLPWSDSWPTLVLDLPRVALVLFFLNLLHRLGRWITTLCCGIRDRWTMGNRLAQLREAELQNQNENSKEAVAALIRAARKLEHDRLFEYLLVSPRYIWNGPFFGRIRNGLLGRAYLLILWLFYICPLFLRVILLLSRLTLVNGNLVIVDICGEQISTAKRFVSLALATFTLYYTMISVPRQIHAKTKEEVYF